LKGQPDFQGEKREKKGKESSIDENLSYNHVLPYQEKDTAMIPKKWQQSLFSHLHHKSR